ncbi:hypothetical protein C6501_19305 [Candidatus Poribacteria bacterium]|nr:MAG: hypothetical protein C6501_19305 [Candidatus Poribacteria bacterium]
MLQNIGAQTSPNFIPMTPEEWLVQQGKMRGVNPDETSADERVSLVMKFKAESEKSARRQEYYQMWADADRLVDGRHWTGHTNKLSEYQIGFVINKVF